MKTTTIRMDDTVLDRLDSMAKNLNRSRAWVISQAIERFLNYEEWFVREVEAGLAEAQSGDLASPGEVEAKFAAWGINAD